jgi:hypothetical protein
MVRDWIEGSSVFWWKFDSGSVYRKGFFLVEVADKGSRLQVGLLGRPLPAKVLESLKDQGRLGVEAERQALATARWAGDNASDYGDYGLSHISFVFLSCHRS